MWQNQSDNIRQMSRKTYPQNVLYYSNNMLTYCVFSGIGRPGVVTGQQAAGKLSPEQTNNMQ